MDDELVEVLSGVAAGEADLVVSSLSRYSRNSVLLAQIVEIAVAYGASVLTTNLLLRPGEAFARRGPFVPADSYELLKGADATGLSGVHAKHLRAVLDQIAEQRSN